MPEKPWLIEAFFRVYLHHGPKVEMVKSDGLLLSRVRMQASASERLLIWSTEGLRYGGTRCAAPSGFDDDSFEDCC